MNKNCKIVEAKLICTLILLLFFVEYCATEDIVGCGGFVKSDVPISYSRVELKLYTRQGSLKYQTDCAPNNGYYLIPLYDKGDYVLKVEPPQGWSFEPSSVSLHVDGNSDPCSLGQDINFMFRGFSLSGKVVSKGTVEGPLGIHIVLKKQKGEKLQATVTEIGGVYTFSSVMPGHYLLEASHPIWNFEVSEASVTVSDDSVTVGSHIVISGYDVRGQVISEGEPIRGVHFLLFSSGSMAYSQSMGCNNELIKGFPLKPHLKFLCYVTSNNEGKFVFPSLPSGDYKLVPFYKGEHIEFDVSPAEVDFKVKQDSVLFQEKFQVQGFSVSGRIAVTPGGKGISGAKIYLDDKEQATSQENGIYHLENMKTGLYKLEVKVPHINFDPIVVKITPNTPQLPEVAASEFALCGEVLVSNVPPVIDTDSPRHISISQHKGGTTEFVAQRDGKFCTFVKPGTYTVRVLTSQHEENAGLKFIPAEQQVIISNEPVLNVRFTQFMGAIKGNVKCLQKCINVQVLLTSFDGSQHKLVPIVDDKFLIGDLLPGKYEIAALKEEWCWKDEKIEVSITNEEMSEVNFEQVGYHVTMSTSHSATIEVIYPSKAKREMLVGKGVSIHCFPEVGVYELYPLGCHTFQEKKIIYDTANPVVLQLTATQHILTGTVLSEQNVSDISLIIRKHNKMNKEPENLVLGVPNEKKGKLFLHKFTMWVQPHTDLDVEPTSGQLLFRPSLAQIHILDDCMEDAVEFKGISGLFINGNIIPMLESVKIQVKDNTGKIVATVQSDKAGKFIVGPLDGDLTYEVLAEKEGYILKKLEKLGHFKAFKLAEVLVHVENENKEPLSGVLLSLSGGIDYRKNSITQQDGNLSFLELSPGQYFLRPMLKEYKFEPSAKMIEVTEGATVKVKVSGRRVAFSCYGIVNSLTGEAEPGVVVEAVGIGNSTCNLYQEEAVSEQDGAFRIRGLQPECEYAVRLKQLPEVNQHIERATPKTQVIKITSSDINGIRLIVFRHFNQMDISGNVVTNQEFLHTLKVRLFGGDNLDQTVHTITLGQNSFFQLPPLPLDNRTYLLRLDTSMPGVSYHSDATSITFVANVSYRHFTLHFKPLQQTNEQDVTQGSLFALPLTLVVILLLYNYNKILPVIGQVLQTLINPARTVSSSEGVSTEPLGGRRKAKPRKIQ